MEQQRQQRMNSAEQDDAQGANRQLSPFLQPRNSTVNQAQQPPNHDHGTMLSAMTDHNGSQRAQSRQGHSAPPPPSNNTEDLLGINRQPPPPMYRQISNTEMDFLGQHDQSQAQHAPITRQMSDNEMDFLGQHQSTPNRFAATFQASQHSNSTPMQSMASVTNQPLQQPQQQRQAQSQPLNGNTPRKNSSS